MQPQVKTPWPSVSALWSLLWRALVLTPFAAIFGAVWIAARPLLFVLPVCEAFLLLEAEWLAASIVPAVWVLLLLWVRSRWFQDDRRYFPNDQENV